MKRAELIIGKTYYISTEAGWRNKTYRGNRSYFETAERNKSNKVIIVETQLKTEHEKKYKTRDVLVRWESGRESWEPLNHIRCTWIEAVRLKTQDYRDAYGRDERGHKYAQHLARKQEREVYRPALNTALSLLKEIKGGYISEYDRIGGAFSIEQLNAIIEGLTLLKTQSPSLKAVA